MTYEIQVWQSGKIIDKKKLESSLSVSVGREGCDIIISNPKVSRNHLDIIVERGDIFIIDRSSFGTFKGLTKVPKDIQFKVELGDSFELSKSGISIKIVEKKKISISLSPSKKLKASPPKSDETPFAKPSSAPKRKKLTLDRKIKIEALLTALNTKGNATIGRGITSDLVLPSMQVSGNHGKIVKTSSGFDIYDFSTNGIFVNKRRIKNHQSITDKDEIRIGTYQFYLKGVIEDKRASGETAIFAENIKKVYSNGYVGLQGMSMKVSSNEFVALMGPSGCGKSTLLKALNGDNLPSEGRIVIHGLELNSENYDLLKKDIGYVPQDDIVHKGLSVNDTLFYAAKLRLADDVTDDEINSQINKVLTNLNINTPSLRKNKVGELSGGQRKRVSIAVELLTEPSILFLDEPTSPLDPETIEDFLNCIRKLSEEEGTTIIMVTHKPSDLKYVDSTIFLSKGGYMTYYGKPDGINAYFKQPNIIGVYSLMSKLESDNKTPKGKTWYDKWRTENPISSTGTSIMGKLIRTQKDSLLRQYYWLSRRYFSLKWNDRGNILLLLSQPFIIAFLIVFIFENLQTGVLFLMAISAVWFGVSNAAKEIVGELPIYRRERMFNMSIWTYLFSKVTILSLIAFIQVIIYVAILYFNYSGSNGPVSLRSYWGNVGFMFYLSLSSTIMGLFLSAVFPNTEKVMTFVPIALIPQIMLAGVVAKLDSNVKEVVSYLTLGRWGTEGFAALQDSQTQSATKELWETADAVGTFQTKEITENDTLINGVQFITENDTFLSSVMSPVPEIQDSIITKIIKLEIPGQDDKIIKDTIGLPTGEMTEEPRGALEYLDFYGHESAVRLFEGFGNNMLAITILNVAIFIALYISLKKKDSI